MARITASAIQAATMIVSAKTVDGSFSEFMASAGFPVKRTGSSYQFESKQDPKKVAPALIKLGAERQDPKTWFPVTKEEALNDFGDADSEGSYYLVIKTKKDGTVEFSIDGNGLDLSVL